MLQKGLLLGLGLLFVSQLVWAETRYTDHEARRIQRAATGGDMCLLIAALTFFEEAGYSDTIGFLDAFEAFQDAVWFQVFDLDLNNEKTRKNLPFSFLSFLRSLNKEEHMDMSRRLFPRHITEMMALSRNAETVVAIMESDRIGSIFDIADRRYSEVLRQLGSRVWRVPNSPGHGCS